MSDVNDPDIEVQADGLARQRACADTRPQLRRHRVELAPVAVLPAIAALYVSTLAVNHSEAEDSMLYIRQVTSGSVADLVHPNHLLFNAFHRLFYRLWIAFGYRGSAEIPMEILDTLAAVLTLWLMLRVLRRLGVRSALSLCCVLATAFSFGFWWYAVECETYILPLPFLLLSFDRLLTIAEDTRPHQFALLGLTTALAVVIHQQHVLGAIVLGVTLLAMAWQTRRQPPFKLRMLGLLTYACVAGVSIVAAYAWAGSRIMGKHGAAEIIAWSRGLARNGAWRAWSPVNPLKSLVGFGRGVLGLHMLFSFDAFRRATAHMFPNKILLEEAYLVSGTSPAIKLVYLGLVLTVGLGALGLARLALRACAEQRAEQRGARAFKTASWLFLAACAAFNTWWEPQNVEFWIAPLPFFYMLVALRLEAVGAGRAVLATAGALVCALGLANLLGSVLPQISHDRDYWYAMNRPLIDAAKAGDIVLTNGGYISDGSLRLYTAADIVSAQEVSAESFERRLAAPRAGRVFVSSWLRDPMPELRGAGLVQRQPALFDALMRHGRLVEFAHTPAQTIYILQ